MDIVITGAEEFATLARRLKQAPAELRRELYAGLNRATGPPKRAAKASALARLPQRGGLAARVAGSRLSTRSRSAGARVGVRIEAKGLQQLALIDKGTVVHPTYGGRPRVAQPVSPGWFTLPMEAGAPLARRELDQAIKKVARKVEASI